MEVGHIGLPTLLGYSCGKVSAEAFFIFLMVFHHLETSAVSLIYVKGRAKKSKDFGDKTNQG
jgi:hypothetical protein